MATILRVINKLGYIKLFRPNNLTYFERMQSTNSPPKPADESPVKFTTSKAAAWTARSSRGDVRDDKPWFELYVVLSSVTVFMLYFCVFREENDLDDELRKTLYDRIPGLEKKQLELVLGYNESKGLDTTDIKNRLEEIAREDQG